MGTARQEVLRSTEEGNYGCSKTGCEDKAIMKPHCGVKHSSEIRNVVDSF